MADHLTINFISLRYLNQLIQWHQNGAVLSYENLVALTYTFNAMGNHEVLAPMYENVTRDNWYSGRDAYSTHDGDSMIFKNTRHIKDFVDQYRMVQYYKYYNQHYPLMSVDPEYWKYISQYRKFSQIDLKEYAYIITESAWLNHNIPLQWLIKRYGWNAGLVQKRLNIGPRVDVNMRDMAYMYTRIGLPYHIFRHTSSLLVFRRVLRHRASRRRYRDSIDGCHHYPTELTKIIAEYAMISYRK